jgi:carbamoyl-phosphate synthase large subunit
VNKVHEGRPHILDRIKNDEYNYIVNTTEGRLAIEDSRQLRRAALRYKVNYTTTLNGAFATCQAHTADPTAEEATVSSVQELHERISG